MNKRNILPYITLSLLTFPVLLPASAAGASRPQTEAAANAPEEAMAADDNVIYIAPLFEYPIAPEELPDLQSKSDYLMDHFWDAMDFSKNEAVDQTALNHAFQVYSSAMPYASPKNVISSVDALLKQLKGNPALTYQFTRAAEESLYSRRAAMWSDDVYIPFLKAVVAESSIPSARRERYDYQLKLLQSNAIGKKFPTLKLTMRDGRRRDFHPEAEYTLVEFGNPDCDDCRFAKMKLSMAADLSDFIADHRLEILFIVADAVPEEKDEILQQFSEFPSDWNAAIAFGADDKFDLRQTPSFYILDKKGAILAKNLDVTQAVDRIRALMESSSKKQKK